MAIIRLDAKNAMKLNIYILNLQKAGQYFLSRL